jgi:hypothetical protein
MQERLYLVPYEWKTVFVLFVTFCYKDCFGEPPLRLCAAQCVDWMTVEAAASATLEKLRAARLPPQNYFGATEATIFSKHGSPRRGSHHGISFNSP